LNQRPSLPGKERVLDLRLLTLESLKRRLFWIVAHTCIVVYRWIPLFGTLRASIAIIRREQKFLLIERNDGRGVSLPGGISNWREAQEDTLRREVLEETGLQVSDLELRMRYFSATDLPCDTYVFEARAEGEMKESWEGSPRWMTADEVEPRILKSQRRVVELLRELSDAHGNAGTDYK
jgi:8-oxo-dGTP pyrophosphatase MutT (NUDIX family)